MATAIKSLGAGSEPGIKGLNRMFLPLVGRPARRLVRPRVSISSVTRKRTPTKSGLSFSGGGFLGAYHLGAWITLRHQEKFWVDNAHVTGSSVGAIIGAALVSDLEPDELAPVVRGIANVVRAQPLGAMNPFTASLVDYARTELNTRLPSDAHERCTGRLHVCTTRLEDRPRISFVSSFACRETLLDVLVASSFVPGVTGSVASMPTLAGCRTLDGGLVRNWPRLPLDRDEYRTVFVSPFSGAGFDICPLSDPNATGVSFQGAVLDSSPRNILTARHAIFPPDESSLDEYLESGKRDAERYLSKCDELVP